jgi:uncharacterized metal-binding protein YceD (DUF177 family)
MSAAPAPEFSRPVRLVRVGTEPLCRQIAATETECAALARRFDLVALDRLSAAVELVRHGSAMFLLRGAFDAEFVQSCVVTLDPVRGAVSEHFTLLLGPTEAEPEAAGTVGDEVAFEPLVGDVVDIGEAVAQELALALPPFPRSPDAEGEVAPPVSDDAGPFAALSQLVDRRGD